VAAAVYEALMVRWSMGTPAAARAREALRRGSPVGPLEHAVHAHDHHYALEHLQGRLSGPAGPAAAPGPGTGPVTALAELTGEDVVVVTTPDPGFAGPEIAVVRVVAPGARRPPDREPPGTATPPHPVG
jgi:ribosomal protein S12 methylthiotransferase accessory factor